MREFRIEIRVDAGTKEAAILWLESKLARIKEAGWRDTAEGGGGSDGPSFGIWIGPVPLSLDERLRAIEEKLDK